MDCGSYTKVYKTFFLRDALELVIAVLGIARKSRTTIGLEEILALINMTIL